MSDGGLRLLFRQNMPKAQWTSIETGGTAAGVPDSEFCFEGNRQGWVEHKRTLAYAVKFQPGQIGWIDRRVRLGGRVFIAVRRINKMDDQLFLFRGVHVVEISQRGVMGAPPLAVWKGGPRGWEWREVAALLQK